MNKPYKVSRDGKVRCKKCGSLLVISEVRGKGQFLEALSVCPKCNPDK